MHKAMLFSLQGRMVVKEKATFSEIERFEFKPSESQLEEQASQTSESVGVNALSLSLNVGAQEGKNELTHKTQTPAQLISQELEIDARIGHLQGGEIVTEDNLENPIHFDELIIEGIVGEVHSSNQQTGWSIGVPLLPVSGGALNALNLFQGATKALSAASFVTSAATSIGGQRENSAIHRRKQVGLPKLYSVNPETGEIKLLQGTIGHLHTKVSASSKDTVLEDTGLSEFEITSHTHEITEEYDRQERTGFAAPIGAVTGIYGNVAWISEKLTASPAAEAVATPEVMTKTLVEDVAQEATKSSPPERRKLERATKKFVQKESVQQDLETLHHANRVLAAAREQSKGNALANTAQIGPWSAKLSDPHTEWSGKNQDMPLEQFLNTPLGNQRVSREEVEHAQTVASQAWGRIKNEANEFVANNPKASKAIGNFLWGAAEGLRGWYYFEAAKTGMLVGGAVAGPAGVLFGGAAGLLMAYGTENVTQAATAGGIELAAQLVGGADGQVIREAAPVALTALGLRTARKTIGKASSKTAYKNLETPAKKFEIPLDQVGEYRKVRGHHVHAKKGFEGHVNYDPSKGFSMSENFMKDLGIKHRDITTAQHKMFVALEKSGRPNTMKEHTRIAVNALVEGGVEHSYARFIVSQSLQSLRTQNVRHPTTIPWSKK